MRRICVVTSSRADYGPLLPVLLAIRDDPKLELRIVASGGHLVPVQGWTAGQILVDGFEIDENVETVLASDTATATVKSLALNVLGYVQAFDRLSPDIVVVLGDRYEALAAAVTAALKLIPLAHIGGGELTVGAVDDSVRHAVSKLAHVHFTANGEFRNRVIQLGEPPDRVFEVGAPGLDTIKRVTLVGRAALSKELGLPPSEQLIVATYHPVTAAPEASTRGAVAMLEALELFPDSYVVFTGTNVDHGGGQVAELIDAFVRGHAARATFRSSLGQVPYLSLVKHADLVLGNSSSGLVEAPFLRTPTVNIGKRQAGRPRADSVIDCTESTSEVAAAIRYALGPAHRAVTDNAESKYGQGGAGPAIARVLRELELQDLCVKTFFDVGISCQRARLTSDAAKS
ncbi:UDP-N-acetylglucosamine 2-epimerase (hydrolyzing) [Amycolatopsis acidicola]|uniref:UDP-N-acetylglucosamine 2-epimerase (Hydrolyzing) n=1 Tax=Amycolatopsis acidicola TaxID=2596893 RepID=A0A5N0VH19_9PSEU|nr:UDP-N-acetylglucosamine 2-epimerase [Amycolatopsis acidicola]KAA9164948.1 UDP-N-acetylglucosamine 2-epimerase (hydrolyzing) [Amycolatopsis acidicola]